MGRGAFQGPRRRGRSNGGGEGGGGEAGAQLNLVSSGWIKGEVRKEESARLRKGSSSSKPGPQPRKGLNARDSVRFWREVGRAEDGRRELAEQVPGGSTPMRRDDPGQ